jgi:hypothetical protein
MEVQSFRFAKRSDPEQTTDTTVIHQQMHGIVELKGELREAFQGEHISA